MEKNILLLTIILIQASSSGIWPTYSCKPSNYTFEQSQCVAYTGENNFNLQKCDDLRYCNLHYGSVSSYCIEKQFYAQKGAYPGERCRSNVDCIFGTCNVTRCEGHPFNHACVNNKQCQAGLYCEAGNCKPQKALGDACTSSEQCINTAGCHENLCVRLASLEKGTPVETCGSAISDDVGQMGGYNPLCGSMGCTSQNNTYVCWAKAESNNPNTCSPWSPEDCQTNDAGLRTACKCGYNSGGKSYCDLAPGDSYYENYLDLLKLWVSDGSILLCNTDQRYSLACMETYMDPPKYLQIQAAFLMAQNYPQTQENTECVKETFTRKPWKALNDYTSLKPSSDDDLAWKLLALSIFLIV